MKCVITELLLEMEMETEVNFRGGDKDLQKNGTRTKEMLRSGQRIICISENTKIVCKENIFDCMFPFSVISDSHCNFK